MRVIDLDETGIKLLNNNKKQIYISPEEIPNFLNNDYIIKQNILYFKDKQLPLSDSEITELNFIKQYIKSIRNL